MLCNIVLVYAIHQHESAIGIHMSAWKIPWTEEPGRLQSIGFQRAVHSENAHIRMLPPSGTSLPPPQVVKEHWA